MKYAAGTTSPSPEGRGLRGRRGSPWLRAWISRTSGRGTMDCKPSIVQAMLLWTIRIYRWVISPAKTVVFGPWARCRYTPSCSAYALEAVQIHGPTRGAMLSLKRLCRCHPWGGCGPDPVPDGGQFQISNLKSQIKPVAHDDPLGHLAVDSGRARFGT